MARKSSKARKAAKRKRQRKILNGLLTQHVAVAALASETPVSVALATLREPDRGKAADLIEQLRAE